jgi:SOS-response transcriptional repressor LexA
VNLDAADVIADLLARGHSVRFRARGHSMHPIIRSDDYLLVVPPANIARGDVVLTRADRGLTAHRVTSIAGDVVITRGDNAPADDAPIARERVLGVVTHAERDGAMLRVARLSRLGVLVRRIAQRSGLRWQRHRSQSGS